MNFKDFFQSKAFKITLALVGGIAFVLFVFSAGMFVGFRKAHFSSRWSNEYHRNFGGPRGGFFGESPDFDAANSHGIFGEILKIDQNSFVMKGQDNIEKVVLVSTTTEIRKQRDTLKSTDLKVDNSVVVIGSPNEKGQIDAKLIRLFPN